MGRASGVTGYGVLTFSCEFQVTLAGYSQTHTFHESLNMHVWCCVEVVSAHGCVHGEGP